MELMYNRYNFNTLFGINPHTQDIFPLYNTIINRIPYRPYISIPRGSSFGGIDIYRFVGRTFTGTWDQNTRTVTIVGVI